MALAPLFPISVFAYFYNLCNALESTFTKLGLQIHIPARDIARNAMGLRRCGMEGKRAMVFDGHLTGI